MADFKYQLGDIVIMKTGLDDSLNYITIRKNFAFPLTFMIVARRTTERVEGTVISYLIKNNSGVIEASECELFPNLNRWVDRMIEAASELKDK